MSGSLRWKVAQFAERHWWKNYLGKKDPEEYLKWKSQYWQEFQSKIAAQVDLKADDKIVDLGCGPAGIFMIFPEHNVEAVDPLIDAYAQDLAHFDASNYPRVHFVNSAIEDYSNSEAFDVVYCINAINHVRDLQLGFDKVMACAKSGAKIVISIDAHNRKFLKKVFQLLPGDILHPHQYDLEEYKNFCTNAGAKILDTHLVDEAFIFNYYLIVAEKL